MKKSYVLGVILMVLLLLSGCTKAGVGTKSNNDTGQPPSTESGDVQSASSEASPAKTAIGQKDSKETPAGESKGAEVIVKSGSEVASKDKAALLNQIDQELNQMIKDINDLEDISDSDLP